MKLSREFVRDGEAVAVQVERVEGDRFRVRVGDQVYDYDARAMPDGGVRLQQLGEGPAFEFEVDVEFEMTDGERERRRLSVRDRTRWRGSSRTRSTRGSLPSHTAARSTACPLSKKRYCRNSRNIRSIRRRDSDERCFMLVIPFSTMTTRCPSRMAEPTRP